MRRKNPVSENGNGLVAGTGRSSGVDVRQRGNDIVVHADLPGVKKEDIEVHVENGVLTISGERSQGSESRDEGVYRSERSHGAFHRAIPLPEDVDEDRISATCSDGVLEITVPMQEQRRPRGRRIELR